MRWSELPDDRPVLRVGAADKSGFTCVVATSFKNEADARDYRSPKATIDLPAAWSGDWLTFTKTHLAELSIRDGACLSLWIKYGEHGKKSSLWALVRWNDDDAGF